MAGNWTFIISSLFALCTNIITVFESNSVEYNISNIFPDIEKGIFQMDFGFCFGWAPSIGRKVGIPRGILPHIQTGESI